MLEDNIKTNEVCEDLGAFACRSKEIYEELLDHAVSKEVSRNKTDIIKFKKTILDLDYPEFAKKPGYFSTP